MRRRWTRWIEAAPTLSSLAQSRLDGCPSGGRRPAGRAHPGHVAPCAPGANGRRDHALVRVDRRAALAAGAGTRSTASSPCRPISPVPVIRDRRRPDGRPPRAGGERRPGAGSATGTRSPGRSDDGLLPTGAQGSRRQLLPARRLPGVRARPRQAGPGGARSRRPEASRRQNASTSSRSAGACSPSSRSSWPARRPASSS